jgi:hypothetical protein
VEFNWFGLILALFSTRLGPVLPSCGPSPLGLMSGLCFVVFFVYFEHIFHVVPTCPTAIDELPKLVEYVSYKP